MKKNSIISIITFLICLSGLLQAQYDARELPPYLDAKKANDPISMTRKIKVFYHNDSPEAMMKRTGSNTLLSNNGIQIKNVTMGNNNQSETWIAVNPTNPLNIIAGANDYRYLSKATGYRMGAYYTKDGGQTWNTSSTPDCNGNPIDIPSGKDMLVYDPGLAFDTQGNCYYSYGAAQIDSKQADYDNGLFVSKSTDEGTTWQEHNVVALSQQGIQYQEFNDRYSIACDINTNSKYKDNIYLTWRRFIKNDGICFAKSTDHNDNWSQPITLSGGSNPGTQSPVPIVGPDGEIYVVWQATSNGYTQAVLEKSTDGGVTWWSSPKLAQSVTPVGTLNTNSNRYVLTNKASLRITSLPYIAVDNSNGPRKGYVYIVQTGQDDNNKTRVFLAKSSDGGNNWITKIPIDDNPYGNDMFFPSISVDRSNGMVAVLYYSSQNDPTNVGFDAYCAISMDGENFRCVRLTPQMIYVRSQSSDVAGDGNGNNYWGDYTSITTNNGNIYPCWWMPAQYNTPFYDDDVFVGLLSPSPLSPSNLKADNIYSNPTQVKLTWVDPTLDQLGENLGNFNIIVYRGSTEVGQVNKGVQEYTDNGAVDGQPYSYSIKAKTTNGFESALVTVNGTAGGALQPFPPENIIPRSNSTGILLSWKNPSFHIDSSYAQDITKINIYKEGVLIQSVTNNITAGNISSVQLNLPTEKFYLLKLTAVGKRGTVETESDSSITIVAYAGAPLNTFHENFDDTTNMVPTYTNDGWGTTNLKSVSPPNSITDSPVGKYKNNDNNTLYFPSVIMNSNDTTLSFEHIALIDKGGDYGIVSISKDFGMTWKDNLLVNILRSTGFTGDITTSQWYHEGRDISEYKNDTIMVKFSLVSNGFLGADGWYIDDLRISNEVASVENNSDFQAGIIIKVSPNPASNNININVTTPVSGNVVVSFYDLIGNLIKNVANDALQKGDYTFNVNSSAFYDGIYYCRVSVHGITKTIPIVINK